MTRTGTHSALKPPGAKDYFGILKRQIKIFSSLLMKKFNIFLFENLPEGR